MLVHTVLERKSLVLLSHKDYVPVHKIPPSSTVFVLAKFSVYLRNIRVHNFLQIIYACVCRRVVLF